MAFYVVLFLMCFGYLQAEYDVYLGDLPMENPDLFQGDILGIESIDDLSAIVGKERLWPEGNIPYEIDPGLGISSAMINIAFSNFKRETCISFIPKTDEKDYIRIFAGDGCYSHVGRTGGQQPLSLGQGCGWMGTIQHELNHAVGFYHEQNRSDRDDYLIIYWDNIKEGLEDQFFKLKPDQNQLLTPFDYDSLMLYGSYSFSKERNKLKTMVGKEGQFLQEVIHKYFMSKNDYKRINMLYDCKPKM